MFECMCVCMYMSHSRRLCTYVCMYVCMYVCARAILKSQPAPTYTLKNHFGSFCELFVGTRTDLLRCTNDLDSLKMAGKLSVWNSAGADSLAAGKILTNNHSQKLLHEYIHEYGADLCDILFC